MEVEMIATTRFIFGAGCALLLAHLLCTRKATGFGLDSNFAWSDNDLSLGLAGLWAKGLAYDHLNKPLWLETVAIGEPWLRRCISGNKIRGIAVHAPRRPAAICPTAAVAETSPIFFRPNAWAIKTPLPVPIAE